MTTLRWQETACDWCGCTHAELLFEGPDRLLHLPGRFRMVCCARCGLLRQNPRLAWESLKQYYAEGYDSYAPLIREESSYWRRLDRRYGMWKQLRTVERFQRGGRLLDVGCGTGIFLEEAQRAGRWEVCGVEPTEAAGVYAREALQAPIHLGRFDEVDLPAHSFDVVTFWNVLEHVEYPIRDLRRAHQLLKINGWLIFSIPHAESFGARLFGPYWVGWDLPRHLYVFPQPILRHILNSIGFRPVDRRCISTSYALLGHSLDFASQDETSPLAPSRGWLLRLYHTLPVRAGLIVPLWLVERLLLGDIVTIAAQKVVP